MILMVDAKDKDAVIERLAKSGEKAFEIGSVTDKEGVEIILK